LVRVVGRELVRRGFEVTVLAWRDLVGLTERFSYWAGKDDFAEGLRWLLEGNRWKRLGEEGYKYVRENHSIVRVITQFINKLEGLGRR
jgi:glycosyltransferase involved in cell wall biosynthesis